LSRISATTPDFNEHLWYGRHELPREISPKDGTSWLARIQRFNATSPTPILQDYPVRSEGATLQFIPNTAVLAPKIFDYALEGDGNSVGVSYILMEKMPGTSLRWSLPSRQQKMKVMSQVADIYRELHAYPFTSMGSINLSDYLHIGGFAWDSSMDFTGTEMLLFGPCSSTRVVLHDVCSPNIGFDYARRELFTARH